MQKQITSNAEHPSTYQTFQNCFNHIKQSTDFNKLTSPVNDFNIIANPEQTSRYQTIQKQISVYQTVPHMLQKII